MLLDIHGLTNSSAIPVSDLLHWSQGTKLAKPPLQFAHMQNAQFLLRMTTSTFGMARG
jgi:hypothetical protein